MATINRQSNSTESRRTRLSSTPEPGQGPSSNLTSPAVSIASDKENRTTRASTRGKRKSADLEMATPAPENAAQAKRRKTSDRRQSQSQTAKNGGPDDQTRKYYDPEQDPDQRRRTKRKLRDLASALNDNKSEYLQADSRGLIETLTQADKLYENVRQTSDATIDSRLLVTAADLSYKKIQRLTLGDSSVGVDVDDFVTKCISFMQQGAEGGTRGQAPTSTQTQRRRRQQADDDGEADNGDWMNWKYLGRQASLLHNSRPCLSGFLLGPLSVQKKVRQPTQRRAKEAQTQPSQQLRPIELRQEEVDQQESASLSTICTEIRILLHRHLEQAEKIVTELLEAREYIDDEPTEAEVHKLMYEHGLAADGGVPLFKFCVNPQSFGQTVENMFYVSFLVKEGRVGLNFDGYGLPTLHPATEKSVPQRQETQKNQTVLPMSFEVWEELIESFGIEKSVIPHRKDQNYDDGTIDLPTRGVDNGADEDDEDDESGAEGGEDSGLAGGIQRGREVSEDSDMYE